MAELPVQAAHLLRVLMDLKGSCEQVTAHRAAIRTLNVTKDWLGSKKDPSRTIHKNPCVWITKVIFQLQAEISQVNQGSKNNTSFPSILL